MFCRNAVRYFSFGKKKKGKEKLKDKLRKKFNELFYPERCKPVPVPKLHPDTCAVNPDWRKPRVVIVGGGIAGLSAAQRLLQCGIDNFVILEGTNRPGGRIHSRWMGDCMTELGALWIEGASISNLIFLLAVQEGLLSPPLKRFKTGQNTTFFTSDGRSIDKRISDIAVSTFKDLIESKASADKALSKYKSLGVYLDHVIAKELGRFPCGEQDDMASVMGCLYNELKSRIGQDLCRVRVKALREMQKLPGGNVRIPLGFGSVLAPLLRTLPPCSIIYCKPVHYIVWGESSPNSRATVVCTDKDEFPADYVVLTLPLGVLKNYMTTMFVPPLPKTKVRAINRIGVADVERIFIQYEQPFWGAEAGIGLGWKFNEIHGSVEEWWRGLGELTAVPGSNVILQGMVSGKEAGSMCGIPREQLIEEVGNLLRKFTGDPSLSNPFDVQHSNWAQDPFFYGAYSFLELSSRPQLIRDMAEPLPLANEKKDDCHTKHLPQKPSSPPSDQPPAPIVLFAGEATSVLNFSTVHGARESGIREAQRIIKLTKLCKGPPACKTPCPPCKTK